MSQKNRNNFNNQKKVQPTKKPSFVSSAPQIEKKVSKPLSISSKEQIILTILSLIIFVAVAGHELIRNNSDMLFMAQGRSMFTYGAQFFEQFTTMPGCVIAWLGCYFTQFFYHPVLGSCILIAFWCLLFFLTKQTFRLNNTWGFLAILPLTCLLISTIDTGYWMYYLKQPGYFFRETLGFTIAIALTYIGTRLHKYYIPQCIFIVIAVFAGYYTIGWYALLAGLYLLTDEWLLEEERIIKKVIVSIVTFVVLIATPFICYSQFFTEIRHEDIFIGGFPLFNEDQNKCIVCEIPFIILAVIPFIYSIIARFQNNENLNGLKAHLYHLLYILVIIGCGFIIDAKNFSDYNYHAECRMYRAVDEQRWDDVLEEASNYSIDPEFTPTREMVIFNHIALMNKGTMGTKMFSYNNFGRMPNVPDTVYQTKLEADENGNMVPALDDKGQEIKDTLTLHVHMVQTAGPLIYYNHAKTNFASRWCIENSVEYGYSFNETKILVLCALINGEWDVAKKYIDILKKSIYYKSWAERYEPLVKSHNIKAYHEFDYIREIYSHMGSTLDGDNGLCEMYLLNYFSHTQNKDSKKLQELTLNYALIQKDIQLFWPRFFLYAQLHKNEEMPKHYQEAAFLYGNLEHQVNISKMPFNKDIPSRYASFQQVSQQYLHQGISVEEVGNLMKPDFGDTFWWFYFFCRDVKSY